MTADACATCGHAKNQHIPECTDAECWGVESEHPADSACTVYLPPRPVPDSRCDDPLCRCRFPKPASVPAPHAEAEAAWREWGEGKPFYDAAAAKSGFIAGYLRGRGDRG